MTRSFPEIIQSGLREAYDAVKAEREALSPTTPPHDVQIKAMFDLFRNYNKVRFKAGEIITPSPHSNLRHAGEPHLVLEVNEDAMPNKCGENTTSSNYGRIENIRVLCYAEGTEGRTTYTPFWCEAWQFEYFEKEGENAGRPQ